MSTPPGRSGGVDPFDPTDSHEPTDPGQGWTDHTDPLEQQLDPLEELRTDAGLEAIDPADVVPVDPAEAPINAGPIPELPSQGASNSPGSSSRDPDSLAGVMVAGRYRIERLIASGGMGRVYLATQLPLGRPVAVKMVRTEIAGSRQQFLKRFFLEASASAKLTHPNIITVHDYGETEGGDVFMAMEYLDGRSLDKEIKQSAPMPPERALHIGIQIVRALREAHNKGIIHRDLKPQNVMLVSSGDEQDFVKVLDFGLVKMFQPGEPDAEVDVGGNLEGIGPGGFELTRAGVLLGSPNYMSPEQILGGTLDPRTDIYSFGVVLFKMLSGKNPYARDEAADVIYKHVYYPVPAIGAAGVEVPPEVEEIVGRCLAKSRDERYPTCKELVLALKEARRAALGAGPKRKKKRREDPEAVDALSQPVAVPSLEPERKEDPSGAPSESEDAKDSGRSMSRMRSVAPEASAIYLRGRDGAPIGPVPLKAIEVLYCERILDERTPVSSDGSTFGSLSANPDLLTRLIAVKQRVINGEDPWLEARPTGPPLAKGRSPLGAMFDAAAAGGTGALVFPRTDGDLTLCYQQGRIVEILTDVPQVALSAELIRRGNFTLSAFEEHLPVPPARSGDLGDALIAAGLIPPHRFLEEVMAWAKNTLGAVVGWEPGSGRWEEREVPPPQVPLGFDRFGILVEAARLAPKEILDRAMAAKETYVVVPSSPNGATLDDLKLAPKELRMIRQMDGSKSVKDLLAAAPREQREALQRTLYFAIQVGLVVWGEDQVLPRERAEAQRLLGVLQKLKEKSAIEVLNVNDNATDDDVRSKFKDLVKQYHPDSVRKDAAPELVDAMRQLFSLVQASFEQVDTAEKREKYKSLRALGYEGNLSEEEVVKRVLEAEVLFKKAKTLIKLSKYEEGIAAIKEAIRRKPKDVEFKVHARYFEFMANKGSDRIGEATKAIAEIATMIKGEEVELASAYLFLGKLNKVVGREDLALKFFKKVLKFDPRNHDAESEIRLANLREEKAKKKSWLGRLGGDEG